MKRKSDLSLNRTKTHKRQLSVKSLKLLKSSWIRKEEEVFCYSKTKKSPLVCRTEITVKKTVLSPKSIRITQSTSGTPRKQFKRNLL